MSSVRCLKLVLALVAGLGCLLPLAGCSTSSSEEEFIIIPEGKADDFFAMTAQEYVMEGTSSVTLEASYAGATDDERLARAKEIIGYKHVVIEWFLNVYLIDKSDHDSNEEYGGFKSIVKAGSYEDMNITEVDELTFEFTFQMIVGGTNDLMSLIPSQDAGDGKRKFTLQMGIVSNSEMDNLEFNDEWYRSSKWSGFNPVGMDPQDLEPIELTMWPETRSVDAWIDYNALYADGWITIDVHFGWDYHGEYHLKHSETFYNWLTSSMGFDSPVGSYDEYNRISDPLTKTFTANGREVTAEIRLYWGKPGTDTDPDTAAGGIVLENDMRESLGSREVIIYSGHSGFLYGFALANWRTTDEGDLDDSEIPDLDMPTTYQLVVAEGCDTYAMGEAFWANPAKPNHSNLDVITTTSFSNATTPAVVQDVIRALVPRYGDHEPQTYGELLKDLDTNSYWFNTMYGVHGIDDNPKLHPYNQCSRLNDNEKVCTAFCTDDSGCPEGFACLKAAQGYYVTSKQCVPNTRSCAQGPDITGPTVIINEVLADPPMDLLGDANGDGVRSFVDDEFVELVNVSAEEVDLSGYTISDGVRVRFTFPAGTSLPAGGVVVVFGGGDVGSFSVATTGEIFACDAGLGLTNTGDTVTLADAEGNEVDQMAYGSEGGHDRSLTRAVDGDTEATFIAHPNLEFSPGLRSDGSDF
jgi:hypothetical protein